MNTINYTKDVLKILDKPLFDIDGIDDNTMTYKRATDDENIVETLKVRKKDGTLTDNVFEFLDEYSPAETHFFKEIKDAIWGHMNMNPREESKYDGYFVKDASQIRKFDELLEMNDIGENLRFFDCKVIFQLGKKGVGKTLTQNVWLHSNHKKLETEKIFWVRLDVEKLYNLLWKKEKYITTEEYFLGQLLYVFCKRFKKFPYIDEATKKVKFTNSELITEIYENLCGSSSANIFHAENLTKTELKLFNDPQVLFQQKSTRKNYSKITDYFNAIEEIIAKYENTYIDGGKGRLGFAPNRRKSFLIDKVFQDKNSDQFKIWMYLGNILKTFILEKNNHILYIVDGIDNINFEDAVAVNGYRKLLDQLVDFPLSKDKVENKNEQIFIAMRNNTLADLKKYYKGYAVSRNLHDIETAHIIDIKDQIVNDMARRILRKRIDYVVSKSKWYKKSYMARVLEIIERDHAVPIDLGKKWNSNYRTFLNNHIKLAEYITFRYYWRSRKTEKIAENDIASEIRIHDDINFYLNGEIYACDDKRIGDDDGSNCFNLFGFVKKTQPSRPLYFIYTYILLIIKELKHDMRNSNNITEIMNYLGYYRDDSIKCIDTLVTNGMLEQRFEEENFVYDITKKGIFILEKFYNNIQYLYHSCLDTKLPETVFNVIKESISPNNVHFGEERNFPPNCIITGIIFLNYLKFKNKQLLNDKLLNNKKIMEKLSENGLSESTFHLPIKYDANDNESLSLTINKMIDIIVKKENYLSKFEKWLRIIKQGKTNV